jgi:hypothetical protein
MIPANITSELAFLQTQVAAAKPLSNAPFTSVKAMQLNAGNLVADIQTVLVATNTLDTWVAPVDPASMVLGFGAVVIAADDQNNLSSMRGLVGRVASNLDQL